MAHSFFIQANERLLIDRDFGPIGMEAITVDGPMSIETAREAFENYDNATAAYRLSLSDLNIENVTEDIKPVCIEHDPDIDPDPSWTRHMRSMSDTARFI